MARSGTLVPAVNESCRQPLALVALAAILAGAPAAGALECSAPCIQAARGEYRECLAGAGATFEVSKNACLDRDLPCVQACQARREDCDDATGAGPALTGCQAELRAAIGSCANDFPLRSTKRQQCIHQARTAGFQCRSGVRRSLAPALRQCVAEYELCARSCGPAEPPRDVRQCRRESRRTFRAARTVCNQAADLEVNACANKDAACVQSCRDARETCGTPTQATLTAALAACNAQKRAAEASCQATFPASDPALVQCIETADTTAFLCRESARQDAAPGFATCAEVYTGCAKACPSG